MIAAVLIMMCGCAKTTRELDGTEARDPLLRKALAKEREGDKDAAMICLRRALDKNPCLAQAHLRIALLYDEYKKDYVRAIYHYQRYLELRPDTEKRKMIESRVRDAEVSFGATLSGRTARAGEEYRSLQAENARLLNALREVRRNLAARIAASSPSASRSSTGDNDGSVTRLLAAEDKASPDTNESTGRVYVVQPNDTLSTIAAKVYEDPKKWNRIYEANRSILGDRPDILKVGQTLNIPE